ncbi:S8 family peptidase [Micromonospora sp. NBC_01796]|uniref:S8 family peptidase n=1 Tax=Micromonospora sp. NBC_01796 TaxID=2975987 RepID=UPI002DD7B409|nr:S8 family peptidase [Micromonospora sp. NBC_01796]WSA86616.1 S8 family peptidase [Micromonospora sp. NBC_01796]
MTLPRTLQRRMAAIGTVLATTVATVLVAGPVTAAPASGDIRYHAGTTAVPGSYIVVLKDSAVGGRAGTRQAEVKSSAGSLAARYGGSTGHVYGDALNGFEARLSESGAKRLAADPAVAYVEQNYTVTTSVTQTNPPWGLDRIDQPNLPLSATYSYVRSGSGVIAYVIDTGIRITHSEFGGRAIYGYDAVDGALPADDCNGHGTHVAGTVGGRTYGVAKSVRLVAVRVLNCAGSGTLAGVVAGVNWVTSNHQAGQPAVANMSLGGTLNGSINTAVQGSILDGVTYAVAAGNNNLPACGYSPASVTTALTVGATQSNDVRATFSNYGTCLDLFAPGVGILSAWYTSDTASASLQGTSMASPHVAGAAARVLQANPSWLPATVHSFINSTATPGVVINPGPGSPNRLLYLPPSY